MDNDEVYRQTQAAIAEGDRRARHARWQAGETINELESDLAEANEEVDRLRACVKAGDALAKACLNVLKLNDRITTYCLICEEWTRGDEPLEHLEWCAVRAYEAMKDGEG